MTKSKIDKWIEETAAEYAKVLGLDKYEITSRYDEEKSQGYLAMSNRYPYTDHIIWYGDSFKKDFRKGKHKKRDVLHEVCHILTDPLYDKGTKRYVTETELTDERELLTDRLANVIYSLTEQ